MSGERAVPDVVMVSLESWDRVWRRNQHLLAGLIERGAIGRVLMIEPAADPVQLARLRRRPRIGRGLRAGPIPGRLWLFQATKWLPRRLRQSYDASWARSVVRAADQLGLRDPVLWVNDPAGALVMAASGWRTLYDITDDWLLADRPTAEHDRLVRHETALMAGADLVVVCSAGLVATKSAIRPVDLVLNACDLPAFEGPLSRPEDLPPGPVVLYAGTLHRDRLDVDTCVATAVMLRGRATLIFVGPNLLSAADRGAIEAAGGRFLGPRRHTAVPAYLRSAAVLVVPHLVTPFTDSLDPIKVYEYLAARRPIVATAVAGFRDTGLPQVAAVAAPGFAQEVLRALAAPPAVASVAVPSWSDRVDQVAGILARLPAIGASASGAP